MKEFIHKILGLVNFYTLIINDLYCVFFFRLFTDQ